VECTLVETQRSIKLDTHRTTPRVPRWRIDRRWWSLAVAPLSLGVFLAVWSLIARAYPPYILPDPALVYQRFLAAVEDGTLQRHAAATITEALLGFVLGFSVAVVLGYAISKAPTFERVVAPFIVASQAVPVVALAPLLVLWFGHGLVSKVLVCALVVFFPILVNTVVGLRAVDVDMRELFRSLNATSWEVFTKLEVPASLPILFGGIRMGVTLSVIGAVVGEFVGADTGLGALVSLGRGLFDTPLMFVAIFSLVALAMTLYLIVTAIERLVTPPRPM
jgi:NitT/TauT family transport system permease protein